MRILFRGSGAANELDGAIDFKCNRQDALWVPIIERGDSVHLQGVDPILGDILIPVGNRNHGRRIDSSDRCRLVVGSQLEGCVDRNDVATQVGLAFVDGGVGCAVGIEVIEVDVHIGHGAGDPVSLNEA